MLEQVTAYIKQHQLLPEQGEIIVAVSGGADSFCLIHLLHQICGPGRAYPDVTLHAAHLNHMLRGEESAREARIVEDQLRDWGIACTLGKIDVENLAKAEKRSLEEAARLARYHFLRQIAQGKRIAVAHHANDQVETLLLHWLRGTGLSGMVGMLPLQKDIIRPLLNVTHNETVRYCYERGITPLDDQSNSDPRFLRNRIRHEVLPLLQDLNPGIQRTLLRNAEIARIDLDWLEMQIDNCWGGVVVSEQDTCLKLNVRAFLALPLSLQRHLLRRATAHLCEGQSPLEPRHFSLIEQLLTDRTRPQKRELHLPQRLHVFHQSNYLTIERLYTHQIEMALPASEFPKQEEEEISLPVPGEVRVPGTPWLARAEILSEDLTTQIRTVLAREESWSTLEQLLDQPSPYTVYIDGELLDSQIRVRTRRAGDRIQPLGMATAKRVQDIFIDNHVPRAERATIPLFFAGTRCLWVAGSCFDHCARLTNKTRRILRLSIQHFQQ